MRMPVGMPGRMGAAARPAPALLSRRIGLPTNSRGVGPERPVCCPPREIGAGAPGR